MNQKLAGKACREELESVMRKKIESAYEQALEKVQIRNCSADVFNEFQAQKAGAVNKVLQQCMMKDDKKIPKEPFDLNAATGEILFSFA